jgi:2-(1,2-epoxy-1,2-dihydrophenyl)acetyl-CoA isomerase
MSSEKVVVERREGGVSLLMFNNPERRNAIDMEVRDEMARLLDELERDQETRVIVLMGKGEHFSAGGDVKAWKDFSVIEARDRLKRIHIPLRKMLLMEKPIIAMVRGYAVGAGMNFTLASDIVFASEDARFSQSFVRMGLIPDAGGLCLLPVAVGLHRAKELMFTGEMIHASRAQELGMVNRVIPKEALEEETLAFARRLASGPPIAIGMTKRILNTLFLDALEKVFEYEAEAQPFLFQTGDHKEGRAAFLEKREPKFTGQ